MQVSDKGIKIAVFAGGDPCDLQLWSGTPFFGLRALKRHFNVVYVERKPFPPLWHKTARALLKLTQRRLDIRKWPWLAEKASRSARQRLEQCDADFHVSFAGSNLASFLSNDCRQVLISDATSLAITRYYSELRNHWPMIRTGHAAMEREAMSRAVLLTYPSNWAAQSAKEDFGVDPEKVAVIPWGPNMEKPRSQLEVRTISNGTLRLLFIGIDWQRKGGDIALQTVDCLRRSNVDCTLDIIGAEASAARVPIPVNATFHGRLDKANPAQADLFKTLLERAHFLILPTKAEALGMVFAECAATGLPSLSYATGGVETVVRDGETGILLPIGADAAAFAKVITDLASNPSAYRQMSEAALLDSRDRLDWDAWAVSLMGILKTLKTQSEVKDR